MDNQNLHDHPGEGHYYGYGSEGGKLPSPRPRRRGPIIFAGLAVLLVLVVVVVGIIHFATPQSSPVVLSKAAPTSTPIAQPTLQPTDTPTLQPTSTSTALGSTPTPVSSASTPTPVGPETLPEKIILKCDACSDPVVVTITKIVVQPSQNRMLWSLTLYNNSQLNADIFFQHFTLQEGDQSQDPTASGVPTYHPTGPVVTDNQSLHAGETKQVVITFSFVPYQGTAYTLVSELYDGSENVTFNPAIISF